MTSPIKRNRKSQDELDHILSTIQDILSKEETQISIRHLYYRLVGLHLIEKTEQEYSGLCGHLAKWRRTGEIPWQSFSDSTRLKIIPSTFDSVSDILGTAADTYKRNMWQTQDVHLEIWCEKDAMTSVITPITEKYCVPLFVARGFASLTSLYDAANTFKRVIATGKRVIVYHLGDFDPSGIAAGESMVKSMRDDFNVDIQFERLAVTQEQITSFELPTRPVKQTDGRAKHWQGECVELDTMKPADIQGIVETAILEHIDQAQWENLKEIECEEKQQLRDLCEMP